MENNQNEQEMHHEYDGIVEHNNPMPTWWTWSFILCVIFAALYYLHYEIARDGLTLKQELEISMAKLETVRNQAASQFPSLSEDELQAKFKDANLINAGAVVYKEKCAMCHADNLEGKIGPNLTDKTWVHGDKAQDIVKVVREGVGAKGMPAWDGMLKPNEILSVIAFIKSKGQ
ncbi:MAG: cbb3-type cytochrome c oxidase N-terminal domain-containing protein [Pseudobdellovibrio sp.]